MSAAAVIAIRIKRIFAYLKTQNALSEDTAVPEDQVPYSNRWYYRRLVNFGAIKKVGNKCYLDEERATDYRRRRLLRAMIFIIASLIIYILYLIFR